MRTSQELVEGRWADGELCLAARPWSGGLTPDQVLYQTRSNRPGVGA